VEISEEALEEAHDVEARVKVQDGLLNWRYKVRTNTVCHCGIARSTSECRMHPTNQMTAVP
jgi:hypothetical protein